MISQYLFVCVCTLVSNFIAAILDFQALSSTKVRFYKIIPKIGPHIFGKQKGSEKLIFSIVYIKYWAQSWKF